MPRPQAPPIWPATSPLPRPEQGGARQAAGRQGDRTTGQDFAELERQLVRKNDEIEDLQRKLEEALRAKEEAEARLNPPGNDR
jgi:hypothetical protein